MNKRAPVRLSHPTFCKQWLCMVVWQQRWLMVLYTCVTRGSLGHGRLCAVHLYELHRESPGCWCTGAAVERHHGYVTGSYGMAVLWPRYGYIMAAATAAASGRRQAVSRLPCRSGDSKRVCSSYGPSSLLPASELRPCLPWVQWTMLHGEIQRDRGKLKNLA